jgi:hypothetical protein
VIQTWSLDKPFLIADNMQQKRSHVATADRGLWLMIDKAAANDQD